MRKTAVGLVLLALMVVPVRAIQVCHDYTLFRINGNVDPRPTSSTEDQGTGVDALRDYLTNHHYRAFPYTNAIASDIEQAARRLKPGDVIIIRDDHSGVVNERGRIDHFIQVRGAVGKKYDAGKLPRHQEGGDVGGLYLDDTLEQFLSRPFYKGSDKRVEVWRRTAN